MDSPMTANIATNQDKVKAAKYHPLPGGPPASGGVSPASKVCEQSFPWAMVESVNSCLFYSLELIGPEGEGLVESTPVPVQAVVVVVVYIAIGWFRCQDSMYSTISNLGLP